MKKILSWGEFNEGKKETNGLSNDEHMGIKGHQLVAEKIIKYVEENKARIS